MSDRRTVQSGGEMPRSGRGERAECIGAAGERQEVRMDETQRLDYNEDNEEETSNRDRPVGNLHMFAGIHGPAHDFSIYRGQNLIGRHASCDITLPAQSVSKKHAILEVRGDCHTICDNGSLNKTRRGKTALAPHVRYSLSGGDFLLFADVACRYTIEENVAERTGVTESEDDSVLVPATQGALAIEKTPGAAIRRIARGAVLARDSGDDEDQEEGQSRWNDGGCGSFKNSHKTLDSGTIVTPAADTIVPESDEENDTSTSEAHLPSLNLQCDSDMDTSRRSSFVPSSQNIYTPSVFKDQSNHEGKMLTTVDQEEMESEKPTDGKIKLRLAVDDTNESKEKQEVERKVEPLSGGGTLEPCVETVYDKLEAEQECARMLQDDAIKKSSSASVPVSSPCVQEDIVTSSRNEIVQEDPRELNPEIDALGHHKLLGTDLQQKQDNVGLDSDANTKENDTTTSGKDVKAEETSEIETNTTEEGNGRSLGPHEAAFHMDSDTDVDNDEPATTGSNLEKAKSPKVVDAEKSVNDASVQLTEEHSDSDTDVEGDQNVIESESNNDRGEKMMDEPSKTEETAMIGVDSDTDDDKDEDLPKPAENKDDQEEEKKEGFHLDSDTDVEEDVSTADVKEAQPESPKKESKDAFNLDSDTDVDEEVDVLGRDVTKGQQDSAIKSLKVEKAPGVNSDTDIDEDDPIPEVSSATVEKASTNELKDMTALSDVVTAAALHVDSDTDDDDDAALPVAPVLESVEPETTSYSDSAKEAAVPHPDSDTDVKEGSGSPVVSRLENAQAKEDVVDADGIQENATVSSINKIAAVCGTSTEKTKGVPAEFNNEDDETQKSESESVDLETMATQCYLEPQEESVSEEGEEEATQAFIFSSTWAEPDPFKRPADPIEVLQISSVTVNTSEDEIDEDAIAETQLFCTDAESIGLSVQATPEPVERSVNETIQSSSGEQESERDDQQLSRETMSLDATQPVSQCLSDRASQETGTWMHLKREEVPASVWMKGLNQRGESADLEGNDETENATRTDEQSLKLELEATQLYVEEGPTVQEPPAQTITPINEDNQESDVPPEAIEQTRDEDTQATDNDATQAYSIDVPDSDNGTTQFPDSANGIAQVPDSDNGTTQAFSLSEQTAGDGASHTTSVHKDATEDKNTQAVQPSVTAAEEVAPETSTVGSRKLSSRRGLSRSKKNEEPEKKIQIPPEKEQPEKASASPGSEREKPDEQSAGEPQLSEPDKKMQTEKETRRRGGRRAAESQVETTAKEEVPVATTSRKRGRKNSSEAEPSESGINEQRGRKHVSRKSAKKLINEEELDQSASKIEEVKESLATEILLVNPPGEIESLKDDNKNISVVPTTKVSCNQASLENKEIAYPEASILSPVIEINEPIESSDKESDSNHASKNKKPARNKRQVAVRLKNEAQSVDNTEKDQNENKEVQIIQKKDESKQSEKIVQEESQGRKSTRKSRVKPLESDKSEDTPPNILEESKKVEVCSPDTTSGNEKSTRTRRSLKEETKEKPEHIKEVERKTRRSASVKNTEPKNKENKQENQEDMPASNKMQKITKNKSKEETTKPEEDNKIEDHTVARKSRRTQKNVKEEQKTEDNEAHETSMSDSQTSRRTRRENKGEVGMVKEEMVKDTTSRRTRRHSKEEEVVKLEEDQNKKPKRPKKDSKEESKIEDTVEESFHEIKEEVENKTTRKTRKNLKDDEKESKQIEDNSKSERTTRTRAKTSNESQESHEELDVKKTAEESSKLSPQEEKSQAAVGRGRRAAKKEDMPQVSTPVSSRKRGQATKAEEVKRKKSDKEEEQEKLGMVETPKSRKGRPRKLISESENSQTVKEISPPDPSPSRGTRQSSAFSTTPEARTPRRTNRISTSVAATSPYVAQSGSAPKILFTGVVDTEGEEAIRSLGGEIAESVFECTHLVTDRVRRTVKFLCALARGIPIVTLDWIDKCKKSRCFLSPTGFLVNDKEQEKTFNFTLSRSLQKAKKRPLLEGYEIHVTANVKPEPDHMKDIIRCSGATFLPKLPRSFKEKCVIVSCPEDAARCKSVPASVPITSAEFILSGILRQEVNPTTYLLNATGPDTGPTPAKRRR
ncbi:mediator of DNA damage checkpoint protein 1 isoform X2 [Dendrobates tinctorius]|uniref:mediator of DNA damage checkpoint protein 1 isoform X2 n=1 Tax=Dendrobates tinctorius TaxID=92724 RepID=UPI003CCA2C84